VTLVAFGNGASDVITAIISGGDGGSITTTVGFTFGCGLFSTCLTLSKVIQNGAPVKVNKNFFLRDSIFYILSLTVVIIYAFIGSINII
jgi:sodium/potassium/calcium exchanger 6